MNLPGREGGRGGGRQKQSQQGPSLGMREVEVGKKEADESKMTMKSVWI